MENLRPHSALQAPTGLTDLFKAGVGFGHARDSPATLAEAPCAKELNFSQNTAGGMFAESQELGTQDFATPSHHRFSHARPSQAGSQPVLIPALRGPPSIDPHGKRDRDFLMNSQSTVGATPATSAAHHNPPPMFAEGGDLRGSKKVAKLAGHKVTPCLDLCTCTAQEAEQMDVTAMLKHFCEKADGRPRCYATIYEELGRLGQGEFGTVVRVRNRVDFSESAVKMTAAGRQLSDVEVKRCLFEAQLMVRVFSTCPAALQMHEIWFETMDFKNKSLVRAYTRMELCGESLGALRGRGFAFDERTLQNILNQVAAVLAVMHDLGFAHLDVKPDNILAARGGHGAFKLADYGLATRLDRTWPVEEGDRKYVSAELLAGDHRHLAAADVFSLGLTLYELATGAELPHDGELYRRLRGGATQHVQSIRGVSRPLVHVIQRMLAPDPTSRPAATELQAWSPTSAAARASSDSEHTARLSALSLGANRPSCPGSVGACGGGGGDARGLDTLFGRARSASGGGAKDTKRKAGDAKSGRRKDAPKHATLQMTSVL